MDIYQIDLIPDFNSNQPDVIKSNGGVERKFIPR